MEKNIRPYGLGKFNTILDSYVYSVSLDGCCDDEVGSVQENGTWYGLLRNGHTIFKDGDPFLNSLNDDERDMLTGCAGCIVSEDSHGFVSVHYAETNEELDGLWDRYVNEVSEYEES